MTPQQIALVQQTFTLAAPQASQLADQFYQRLFALDPSLRRLFAGDMQEQGDKLMTMLAFAVHHLHQPAPILGAVQRLGERHIHYGVQPHHYATVGAALLWTLAQHFGSAFTPDVEAAWAAAYGLLTSVMQETSVPIAA